MKYFNLLMALILMVLGIYAYYKGDSDQGNFFIILEFFFLGFCKIDELNDRLK